MTGLGQALEVAQSQEVSLMLALMRVRERRGYLEEAKAFLETKNHLPVDLEDTE